jgi:hypothetical protein
LPSGVNGNAASGIPARGEFVKLSHFLMMLIDPARAQSEDRAVHFAAVEVGPLLVQRLEERRVLAGGLLSAGFGDNDTSHESDNGAGSIGVLTVPPVVTVPPNQAGVEGTPLIFSAANGRLIRVDDPDIGSSPLVVNLSAADLQGGVLASITLTNTSGLTSLSGNGSNLLQLEGTLTAINAALSHFSFYSPDNGNFGVNVAVSDPTNSESGSASFQVSVANADPHIQLVSSSNASEGHQVEFPVTIFDVGPLDQPHHNWSVSYQGSMIASGVDRPVEFFAFADGRYDLIVTATDKDGGTTTLQDFVTVQNTTPTVGLTGVFRGDEIFLTLDLGDPGNDRLDVEIFWSQAVDEPYRLNMTPGVITISHRYTPDELDFDADQLTITVHVSDGDSFVRNTLDFGEGDSVDTPRPRIEAPPRTPAPQREAAPRVIVGGALPDVTQATLGGGAIAGKQDQAAIHQFVIRLVGADGEESGNYSLPAGAIQNLPAFLTALGVPDGHYRVYLITGDVERLVLDGHLRAGRIVDPSDESQPSFDQPAESDSPVATATPLRNSAGPTGEPTAVTAPHTASEQHSIAAMANAAYNGTRADAPIAIIADQAVLENLGCEPLFVSVETINPAAHEHGTSRLPSALVVGAAVTGACGLAVTQASIRRARTSTSAHRLSQAPRLPHLAASR